MKTALTIGIGVAAAGAAAAYFSRNRTPVKRAANQVKGAAHAVTPSFGHDNADDATLADRVRSEIFRAADAPKSGVSVDVQAGVAYLRGEVADEAWIERFGKDARNVTGITGVKNLLHAPGTPTPEAEPRSLAAERHNS
jgi:osmotically-inducible protein OsmY